MGENLSRRDFLKLMRGLGGFAALPYPLKELGPPKEAWINRRFFENLEEFDAMTLLEIREDLLDFGKKNEPVFRAEKATAGFDLARWDQEVEKSVSQLTRVFGVYASLKSQEKLDEKAEILLKRDFYNTGSIMWAVLRSQERINGDENRLEEVLKDPALKPQNGLADPFLGKEIFSLNGFWVDVYNNWMHGYPSPVLGCIKYGIYSYAVKNAWWPDVKGPQGLNVYQQDNRNHNRPAEFNYDIDNPVVEQKVKQALRETRLNRVGIDLLGDRANREAAWFGHYIGNEAEESEMRRDIHLNIPEDLTEIEAEQLIVPQANVIHEAGHAVWELLAYIKNDVEVFGHRLAAEQMLDLFRNRTDYKSFFQPQGDFFRGRKMKDDHLTNEEWVELNSIANMTTVTDYFSCEFKAELQTIPETINNVCRWSEIKDITVRLVEDKGENNSSFRDYWTEVYTLNKEKIEAGPGTEFERLVLERINENVDKYEAENRQFYVYRRSWRDYLAKVVVPFTMLQMYTEDREGFKDRLKALIGDSELSSAFEKHIDTNFGLVSGELVGVNMAFAEKGWMNSDMELFADIMAFNWVRKQSGVANGIWDKVDNTLNRMIDNLISDQLAVNPETRDRV